MTTARSLQAFLIRLTLVLLLTVSNWFYDQTFKLLHELCMENYETSLYQLKFNFKLFFSYKTAIQSSGDVTARSLQAFLIRLMLVLLLTVSNWFYDQTFKLLNELCMKNYEHSLYWFKFNLKLFFSYEIAIQSSGDATARSLQAFLIRLMLVQLLTVPNWFYDQTIKLLHELCMENDKYSLCWFQFNFKLFFF